MFKSEDIWDSLRNIFLNDTVDLENSINYCSTAPCFYTIEHIVFLVK